MQRDYYVLMKNDWQGHVIPLQRLLIVEFKEIVVHKIPFNIFKEELV